MSSHTALAEVVGAMQAAGVEPDKVIVFNTALQGKPHLAAWLDIPHADRTRILADRAEAAARVPKHVGPRIA